MRWLRITASMYTDDDDEQRCYSLGAPQTKVLLFNPTLFKICTLWLYIFVIDLDKILI